MACNVNKVPIEPLVCPNSPGHLSVERVAEAKLPTEWGDFLIAGYRSKTSDEEFVVLYKDELRPDVATWCAFHSQCLTGDVLDLPSAIADRSHRTLEMIQEEGRGAVVYQQQEGRGIGISIRFALMPYRTKAQTRSRQMSVWICRLTCATIASARKCCLIWDFAR